MDYYINMNSQKNKNCTIFSLGQEYSVGTMSQYKIFIMNILNKTLLCMVSGVSRHPIFTKSKH